MIAKIILTTTDGDNDTTLGFQTDTGNPNVVEVHYGKRLLACADFDEFKNFLKDANLFYDNLKKLKLL